MVAGWLNQRRTRRRFAKSRLREATVRRRILSTAVPNQKHIRSRRHYESGKDIYQVIERIKKYKVKAGIALRPFTPFSLIVPFIDYLDLVLLMAYSPGTRGQKPISNFEGRIKELRDLLIERDREHVDIAVDGGVSEDKLQIFKNKGANFFIFGTSGLFMPGITLETQIDKINKIFHIQ